MLAAISSAFWMAPFMPFAGFVTTSSAPKARSSTRLRARHTGTAVQVQAVLLLGRAVP